MPARLIRLAVALPLFASAAPAIDTVNALGAAPVPLEGRPLAAFEREIGIGDGGAPWIALRLADGKLSLAPFRGYRERELPYDFARPERRSAVAEWAEDDRPLLVLRAHEVSGKAVAFGTGEHAGGVEWPALREGWRQAIDAGGRRWTLEARFLKGTGGRLLHGSGRLVLSTPGETPRVVLGRTPGLVPREQVVAWAGDLTGEGVPDFLVKRTLATGEVDWILALGLAGGRQLVAGDTVDPDGPAMEFVSGIEQAESAQAEHFASPRPYPVYRLPSPPAPVVTYARAGAMPVHGIRLHRDASGLPEGAPRAAIVAPGVKRDFTFVHEGETWRIVAEVIETWSGEETARAFGSRVSFGAYGGTGRSLVVRLHRGARSQVLLVTGAEHDGGDMRLAAGDLAGDGRLRVRIDWWPHYNNHMTHEWVRADEPDRLLRRSRVLQEQGC